MTTVREGNIDRVRKIARIKADNALLRRLAIELDSDLRELRLAAGMKRGRPAVDAAHHLLVVSSGENRDRGA